ncbi:hypothetical protein N474_16390 [Pseudoalteromonas luteoviolacea CPMOR-2]|nr:hypothetical protein N474_16390 [Pseudoalteromonas luteoviolacea CPMOR-2]
MDRPLKMTVLSKNICQQVSAGYKTKRPTSKPRQPPLPDSKG